MARARFLGAVGGLEARCVHSGACRCGGATAFPDIPLNHELGRTLRSAALCSASALMGASWREVRRPARCRSRPPNFSLEPTPLPLTAFGVAAAATPGPCAAQAQAPGGWGCGSARALLGHRTEHCRLAIKRDSPVRIKADVKSARQVTDERAGMSNLPIQSFLLGMGFGNKPSQRPLMGWGTKWLCLARV